MHARQPIMKPMINTLEYSKRLRKSGMDPTTAESQTEALAEVLNTAAEHCLATKEDLRQLEERLTHGTAQLDQKIIGVESRLALKIQETESCLEQKILGVESRLELKIHETESRLEQKILGVESRLELRIQETESRLDSKIQALSAELKTTALTLDAKIDKTAAHLELKIEETQTRMESLEKRLTLRIFMITGSMTTVLAGLMTLFHFH